MVTHQGCSLTIANPAHLHPILEDPAAVPHSDEVSAPAPLNPSIQTPLKITNYYVKTLHRLCSKTFQSWDAIKMLNADKKGTSLGFISCSIALDKVALI